jgi:hypothetical protein
MTSDWPLASVSLSLLIAVLPSMIAGSMAHHMLLERGVTWAFRVRRKITHVIETEMVTNGENVTAPLALDWKTLG